LFKIGSHYLAQAGLKLTILLLSHASSECWDDRQEKPEALEYKQATHLEGCYSDLRGDGPLPESGKSNLT
jgi:hypothetical protein